MSDRNDIADLDQRIGELLLVFSDITEGDLASRCSTDLPVSHPLGALFIGVNEMLDSLHSESKRRIAYQRELEEKLATIQTQNNLIRQLATPLIEVWDRVLCLPVVGRLDDERRTYTTASVIDAVASKRARFVIVDVTGSEIPDAATAQLFVRMSRAVRLLGGQCVLTGISASMAIEFVRSGIELGSVKSYPTLADALKAIMQDPRTSALPGA